MDMSQNVSGQWYNESLQEEHSGVTLLLRAVVALVIWTRVWNM
jgi:hypothetical protein